MSFTALNTGGSLLPGQGGVMRLDGGYEPLRRTPFIRIGSSQLSRVLSGPPSRVPLKLAPDSARAAAKSGSTRTVENWWRTGDPINAYETTMGIPSAVPLQMSDWIGVLMIGVAPAMFRPIVIAQ